MTVSGHDVIFYSGKYDENGICNVVLSYTRRCAGVGKGEKPEIVLVWINQIYKDENHEFQIET